MLTSYINMVHLSKLKKLTLVHHELDCWLYSDFITCSTHVLFLFIQDIAFSHQLLVTSDLSISYSFPFFHNLDNFEEY